MYVCICNAVTDHRIRAAVRNGAESFERLQEELGVSTGCGCCEDEVRKLLADALAERELVPCGRSPSPRPVESLHHMR